MLPGSDSVSTSYYSRKSLLRAVADKIIPTSIVLDVGAGIRPQNFFTPSAHIIIEPFLPYIQRIQNEEPYKIFLNGTWDKIMPYFPDRSVDSIFSIDVLEHFEKKDGLQFIRESERIAKTQIAFFTPLGFFLQHYDDDQIDRWGMKGGYWQSHRSGWTPNDFEGGWEFYVCPDFHQVDQIGEKLDIPAGAFWAIKNLHENVPSTFDGLRISPAGRYRLNQVSTIYLVNYLIVRIVFRLGNWLINSLSHLKIGIKN